jgi:hypothetical protein
MRARGYSRSASRCPRTVCYLTHGPGKPKISYGTSGMRQLANAMVIHPRARRLERRAVPGSTREGGPHVYPLNSHCACTRQTPCRSAPEQSLLKRRDSLQVETRFKRSGCGLRILSLRRHPHRRVGKARTAAEILNFRPNAPIFRSQSGRQCSGRGVRPEFGNGCERPLDPQLTRKGREDGGGSPLCGLRYQKKPKWRHPPQCLPRGIHRAWPLIEATGPGIARPSSGNGSLGPGRSPIVRMVPSSPHG